MQIVRQETEKKTKRNLPSLPTQEPEEEIQVQQCQQGTETQEMDVQHETVSQDEAEGSNEIEEAGGEVENTEEYFDDPADSVNLVELVRRHCIKFKLTQRCVGSLLDLVNIASSQEPVTLPKSYVTLMRTPKEKIIPKYVAPGQYLHFGFNEVSKGLHKFTHSDNSDSIRCNVTVHIDGVSLSTSSKLGAWAIAGSLVNFPDLKPFLLGVYVGYGQPTDFDVLLEDFANDVHVGHTTGFEYEEKRYFFELDFIVADAPARSKITHTMGHGALKGCPFCTQIGFKEPDIGTQYSPEIIYPLRSDISFNERIDAGHHQKTHRTKKGVLEAVCEFPMISKMVPCAMHTFDLGAMKKILTIIFMKKGYQGYRKFIAEETLELSNRYESLKLHHVLDFVRAIRSLQQNYSLLKATECRCILLYYGLLIFKNFMSDEMYQNFLCLSMSARLLSDPNSTEEALRMAQTLLEKFVLDFATFYGYERTYVIHTLLHFVPFVQKYGPLYSFSSYKYENYYQIFKDFTRAKHHIIEQIRNRLSEYGFLNENERKRPNDGLDLHSFIKTENDVHEYSAYNGVNTTFRTDKANCFAMMKDPNNETQTFIVKITKFLSDISGVVEFEYQKITQIGPFFSIDSYDLDSTDFDIFLCDSREEPTISRSSVDLILYKMIATKLYWIDDNTRVMQRLIHTTNEIN